MWLTHPAGRYSISMVPSYRHVFFFSWNLERNLHANEFIYIIGEECYFSSKLLAN